MKKKKEVYKPKVTKYPVIKVIHGRSRTKEGKLLANGGSTVVQLEIENGVAYAGVAFCWALEAYNKVKGKSIAFGRLMKGLRTLNESKLIEQLIREQIGKINEELFTNARDGIKPIDPVKEYVPNE